LGTLLRAVSAGAPSFSHNQSFFSSNATAAVCCLDHFFVLQASSFPLMRPTAVEAPFEPFGVPPPPAGMFGSSFYNIPLLSSAPASPSDRAAPLFPLYPDFFRVLSLPVCIWSPKVSSSNPDKPNPMRHFAGCPCCERLKQYDRIRCCILWFFFEALR